MPDFLKQLIFLIIMNLAAHKIAKTEEGKIYLAKFILIVSLILLISI
jgi:hypothetical protein